MVILGHAGGIGVRQLFRIEIVEITHDGFAVWVKVIRPCPVGLLHLKGDLNGHIVKLGLVSLGVPDFGNGDCNGVLFPVGEHAVLVKVCVAFGAEVSVRAGIRALLHVAIGADPPENLLIFGQSVLLGPIDITPSVGVVFGEPTVVPCCVPEDDLPRLAVLGFHQFSRPYMSTIEILQNRSRLASHCIVCIHGVAVESERRLRTFLWFSHIIPLVHPDLFRRIGGNAGADELQSSAVSDSVVDGISFSRLVVDLEIIFLIQGRPIA